MTLTLGKVVLLSLLLPWALHGEEAAAPAQIAKTPKESLGKDLKQIRSCLMMYRAMNGIYPTTAQGLTALIEKPLLPPVPAAWKALLKSPLIDPFGQAYQYTGVENQK